MCSSNPLIIEDNIFVTAKTSHFDQVIVQIATDGSVLNKYPIPLLYRAYLCKRRDSKIWLAGSTVSPWDPPTNTDRLIVGQLNASGQPENLIETQPYRAIEVSVDSQDALWIGGFTSGEDRDDGELLVYSPQLQRQLAWKPDFPGGVSVPSFGKDRNAPHVITTSQDVICFYLHS